MRASDELHTLESLRRVQIDVARLDNLLLELLARDDQDSKPDRAGAKAPNDPVHRHVVAIARDIRKLEQVASHASNLATHVMAVVPVAGVRKSSLDNCLACGEPCVPRRISGYCQRDYDRWKTFRKTNPDRAAFESWIRSTTPQPDDQGKQAA